MGRNRAVWGWLSPWPNVRVKQQENSLYATICKVMATIVSELSALIGLYTI